ncbi:decreased expression in renal and prostate cancer protein-like [Corvus cornix cornix]|uniref:decreased expression in renal and prostate cancer protein-like n=1 Tax=Corvus cornix cornix TaxID=932674 RepID=UPI001951203D|nr:decreased expression in renal and prostate cancer protein-like [Corvus cornix cornix]
MASAPRPARPPARHSAAPGAAAQGHRGLNRWDRAAGTEPRAPSRWDRADGTEPMGPSRWDRANGTEPMGPSPGHRADGTELMGPSRGDRAPGTEPMGPNRWDRAPGTEPRADGTEPRAPSRRSAGRGPGAAALVWRAQPRPDSVTRSPRCFRFPRALDTLEGSEQPSVLLCPVRPGAGEMLRPLPCLPDSRRCRGVEGPAKPETL